MHLALAVADVVVGRSGAGTVCEQAALGIPAVYVPLPDRQRRAAAQRRRRGRRGRRRCWSTTPTSTPAWIRAHLPVLLVGRRRPPRRARAWAPPRRASGVPRRAPPASPGSSRRSCRDARRPSCVPPTSAACTWSASAAPACPRSPPCSPPAGWCVSGSDAADGPALPGAAGRRRRRARRARRLARRRRRHARRLVGRPRDQPRARPRAGARACGCCTARRRSPRSWSTATRSRWPGAHGKTTTSAMIATALLHAGADPSFAIGGTVLSADGPLGGGRDGAGPAFVAEADESDGSFLAYAPLVARRHQRRARPPRPLRLARGVRGRRSSRSPAGSGPAALLVACADDAGAARLVERRARRRSRARDVAVRDVRARRPTPTCAWASCAADGDRWAFDADAPATARDDGPPRGPRRAQRAQRRGRVGGRAPARRGPTPRPTASARSAARVDGSRTAAPPAACGWSTTTRTTRPRSRPLLRGRALRRRRRPRARAVPAAPVLAHPRRSRPSSAPRSTSRTSSS